MSDNSSSSNAAERAILAGGCFWGMQDLIRKLPGVLATRVGYSGGDVPNATYYNHGQHAEAVEVLFDPARLSYRRLLEFFFQIHDPTTPNRQGNDLGPSYRSAIYHLTDAQQATALETIADVNASGRWPGPVVTEVKPAGEFWEAEPEHQDYLVRNPNGYTCHFVRPAWQLGDATAPPPFVPTWRAVLYAAMKGNAQPPRRVEKSDEEWRAILTADVYRITRLKGTERPFSSEMCARFEPGRYACACCGTLLFDASAKFDSHSGWPSFTQPVAPNVIDYIHDATHGMSRIETTCSVCDAHLGHVFPDGPGPTGLRYCINALALEKQAE